MANNSAGSPFFCLKLAKGVGLTRVRGGGEILNQNRVFAQRRKGRKGKSVHRENEIAMAIVDAAYKIHRTLGPGLLESTTQKLPMFLEK